MAARIARRALREDVHEELLRRIYAGELQPGQRLRDPALAASLGVSRTPVREALLRLAREGLVTADLGRGFEVRALSPTEVREGFPILWTLEILALRSSPPPSAEQLAALTALNREMAGARTDADQLTTLDDRFHRRLLATCPNVQLLEMIASLKRVLLRYRYAYMRDHGRFWTSMKGHAEIISSLRRGDLDSACVALEKNWSLGRDELGRWLDADAPPVAVPARRQRAARKQ